MTFIEGLIVWAGVFALFAGSCAFLLRGVHFAMAKPEPDYSDMRRDAVRHVNMIGYRYLAASIALSIMAFAIVKAAGF